MCKAPNSANGKRKDKTQRCGTWCLPCTSLLVVQSSTSRSSGQPVDCQGPTGQSMQGWPLSVPHWGGVCSAAAQEGCPPESVSMFIRGWASNLKCSLAGLNLLPHVSMSPCLIPSRQVSSFVVVERLRICRCHPVCLLRILFGESPVANTINLPFSGATSTDKKHRREIFPHELIESVDIFKLS